MQPQENLCFHHNYANLYGCSSLDVVKTFPAAFGAGKGGITTYRTRIQRILRIGTDLTKIRLDPINPRHPRSNTTYRTRIQRIARIGTDLLKICFAVVGTADEDTRHEAIAFAPACVGLVVWADSWWG